MKLKIFSFSFLILLFSSLTGCGGSNPGSNAPDITSQGSGAPVITSQIQGVANDAIISDGTVTVYQYDSGQKGAVLGTAKTNSQGLFALTITGYWGAVLIEIKGGSYIDDATGRTVSLAPDQYLSAVKNISPGENIGNLAVTPLTTIAAALATAKRNQGGTVAISIDTANNTISNLYGFDILTASPVNLTSAKVSFSPQAAYGLLLAGFSQMASQISSSNGFGAGSLSSIQLADMMATDALDGVLDGKQFGQQIASGTYLLDSYNYRTKLCQNAAIFLSNARNQSGLGWNEVINSLNPIASAMTSLFPSTDTPKPIDNTAPQITFSISYATPNIFTVTAQAIDDFSGVASLGLTLSPSSVPTVQGLPGMTSSTAITLDFTSLPDGQYTLTAVAIDQAGNKNESTSTYRNAYHFCLTNRCIL